MDSNSVRSITVLDLFILLWKFIAAACLVALILAVPAGIVGGLAKRVSDRAALEEMNHAAALQATIDTTERPATQGPAVAQKRRPQKTTSACLSPQGYVDCTTKQLLP